MYASCCFKTANFVAGGLLKDWALLLVQMLIYATALAMITDLQKTMYILNYCEYSKSLRYSSLLLNCVAFIMLHSTVSDETKLEHLEIWGKRNGIQSHIPQMKMQGLSFNNQCAAGMR